MTLQNRFDQRSFPDRMCLRNPAVGGFGPVREETCLETRVEQCRQNRVGQSGAEQSRAPLDRVSREKQGGDGLKAKSCRCSCPICICCKMFSLILGLDAFVWLVRYIDQDHGKVGNQKGEQQCWIATETFQDLGGLERSNGAEMQFFLLH